jgi:hypothetical protein
MDETFESIDEIKCMDEIYWTNVIVHVDDGHFLNGYN